MRKGVWIKDLPFDNVAIVSTIRMPNGLNYMGSYGPSHKDSPHRQIFTKSRREALVFVGYPIDHFPCPKELEHLPENLV